MTEIGKRDNLLIRIPTTIAQFEQSARKELIVRGLMDVADVHDADFYFFKGEDFRLHGKYRDAISNYNKAIHIDPEHKGSLFQIGYCYYPEENIVDDLKLDNKTRYEKAASAFQKLIAVIERKENIWWGHHAAHYNLGFAQYRLNLYEDAIENFEHAIGLNPYDAKYHGMLGLAQYHLDLYEKAVESFERAIELNPEHWGYYRLLGLVQNRLNLYEDATESFKHAIALNPEHASYYRLGLAQYHLDLYEEAVESFERAIELNPDDAKYHYMLGLVHHYPEERQQSIEKLERRIEELEIIIAELESKKTS